MSWDGSHSTRLSCSEISRLHRRGQELNAAYCRQAGRQADRKGTVGVGLRDLFRPTVSVSIH